MTRVSLSRECASSLNLSEAHGNLQAPKKLNNNYHNTTTPTAKMGKLLDMFLVAESSFRGLTLWFLFARNYVMDRHQEP